MKKIILIEDNKDIAHLLIYALAKDSDEVIVHHYETAEQAKLQDWTSVHTCVADSMLPGEGGGDLLHWLNKNHPKVRRVLLTALNPFDVPDSIKAHSLVLYKPAGIEMIIELLGS